jgi:hypothetical protein
MTEKNLSTYYAYYGGFIIAVIFFGAVVAPILEVRLGLGGETLIARAFEVLYALLTVAVSAV